MKGGCARETSLRGGSGECEDGIETRSAGDGPSRKDRGEYCAVEVSSGDLSVNLKLLICVAFVLTAYPSTHAQDESSGVGVARAPLLSAHFSTISDQTAVFHSFVLVPTPTADFYETNLSSMFVYPGHQLSTPPWVYVSLVSTSHSGYRFDKQKQFVMTLDGERIVVGTLTVTDRPTVRSDAFPDVTVYREIVGMQVPYRTYVRMSAASKAKIQMGPREFDLSTEQLDSLREFVKLTVQVGRVLPDGERITVEMP